MKCDRMRYTGQDMDVKVRLQEFGLSEKQAEIYVLLIQKQELRIQEIVNATRIPRSSIYENLKVLEKLGLVEKVIEENFAKIRPYPLDSIRNSLQEKTLELQALMKDLGLLQKELLVSRALSNFPTEVRYYKGKVGARQVLWNTFKASGKLCVYSEWGRGAYVGMEFYRKFVAESKRRLVSERVITNSAERILDSIRTYTGSDISRSKAEDIRFLQESQITLRGEVFMYNNTYAHIFLKDKEITGFEIESKAFVETQSAIFDFFWQSAIPVQTLLKTI